MVVHLGLIVLIELPSWERVAVIARSLDRILGANRTNEGRERWQREGHDVRLEAESTGTPDKT